MIEIYTSIVLNVLALSVGVVIAKQEFVLSAWYAHLISFLLRLVALFACFLIFDKVNADASTSILIKNSILFCYLITLVSLAIEVTWSVRRLSKQE